jgi:hypothetical protein
LLRCAFSSLVFNRFRIYRGCARTSLTIYAAARRANPRAHRSGARAEKHSSISRLVRRWLLRLDI